MLKRDLTSAETEGCYRCTSDISLVHRKNIYERRWRCLHIMHITMYTAKSAVNSAADSEPVSGQGLVPDSVDSPVRWDRAAAEGVRLGAQGVAVVATFAPQCFFC